MASLIDVKTKLEEYKKLVVDKLTAKDQVIADLQRQIEGSVTPDQLDEVQAEIQSAIDGL